MYGNFGSQNQNQPAQNPTYNYDNLFTGDNCAYTQQYQQYLNALSQYTQQSSGTAASVAAGYGGSMLDSYTGANFTGNSRFWRSKTVGFQLQNVQPHLRQRQQPSSLVLSKRCCNKHGCILKPLTDKLPDLATLKPHFQSATLLPRTWAAKVSKKEKDHRSLRST